jgi:transposase
MAEPIYIGIDISKDNLDIAAYPTGQIWQHKNNDRGIAKTVTKLKALNLKLIVMEATGGLEKPLAEALYQASLPVAVINPRRIKAYGLALGMLAKTDKLDAGVMAHFAAKVEPAPRPVKDKARQELERLIIRREQLSDMLTAENNRLKQTQDPFICAHIEEHINFLKAEIKDLEKGLKESLQQSPDILAKFKLFKSMPGVGNMLSYNLVAKLGELGCLNQREIALLVGLAPVNRDSGRYRGKRTILAGRARVRKAFYMPALAAIRCNCVIRALFERLKARGKTSKVALVACMHKMLTILNSMAKSGLPWSNVYSKP